MCMSVLVALGMLVTGGDGMQPADAVAPGVVYSGESVYDVHGLPMSSGSCDCGCDVCYDDCACQSCHQGHRFGLWSKHGLPHPRHSTCDMPQHYPYRAEPKFYYYFRPYNWFHIEPQQQEVLNYGGDPRNPYDNRFFNNVYEQVAQEYNETRRLDPQEWLAPPATQPAPELGPPPQPETDPAPVPVPEATTGPRRLDIGVREASGVEDDEPAVHRASLRIRPVSKRR